LLRWHGLAPFGSPFPQQKQTIANATPTAISSERNTDSMTELF
jgi:hypothetical protein